ncbi:MAG: HEAT repeat domain-containing protein [Planctomycetota bacterium]|nr:HEAT repeat domain-containing protein [Planctomycetota bacterium]
MCGTNNFSRRQLFLQTVALGLLFAATVAGQPTADPYTEALQVNFGQPRTAFVAIEAEIRVATPEQLRTIETKLVAMLQAPEATKDGKEWACRQLRQVGSEQSAPTLATLLTDNDLATAARMALQSIPGAKVNAALRGAIGKVHGGLQAGVIQTLGTRGDQQAVPLLAPLASNPDPVVAEATLYALGHIGGADALRALQEAQVPDSLKRYRWHAILLCAERLAAEDQAASAATVYQSVFKQTEDVAIKTAALRGIVVSDKANAAPALAIAFKSDHAKLRAAATKFACELDSGVALRPILVEFSALPADVQVTLLGMLRDKAALPTVLGAAQSTDADVRLAALGALGRIGDTASVKILLGVATTDQPEPQAAARRSLQELRGPEIDQALIATSQQGDATVRGEAMRALAARGTTAAVPMLLKAAADADPAAREEALNALGVLADASALPVLVKLLAEAPSDALRGLAEKAIVATCRRLDDKTVAAAPVLAALPGPSPAVRCALLGILARVPSASSLIALRAAAADADSVVQDAAVRGLADWPDAAAMPDLLGLARSAQKPAHKVLALRGVVRLAALPSAGPAGQLVKQLAEALTLATRVEEKKLVLGALAEVPDVAAMDLAAGCLSNQELEVEAATTVVKIAKKVQRTKPDAAGAAIKKIMDLCQTPAARQVAESALILVGNMVNIAPQGVASSPDGLDKDGTAGDDQAGIDGDPNTYWDEQDNQKIYRFVVTFKQPEKITAVSIVGYAQHNFAPKDFEILGDGKLLKKIDNAQYDDNFLVIRLDEATCTTVELKITGYYGGSPAIRELGIYRPAVR